jgi:hypothetical protein
MPERSASTFAKLRSELGWWKRARLRQLFGPRVERGEWEALAAYRGLAHQAYAQRPLRPELASDLWVRGGFRSPAGLKPFFSPARRERENSSHHYGHDIQLKRHAGLPLVGPPLPWLLEHGLKVSREADFESPRSWSKGYLCMGPRRAGWLQERHGQPAHAIGPWLHYARPLLELQELADLRAELGPSLLVLLAHSWDKVERHLDLPACVEQVQAVAADRGYGQVIWLRHWQDPPQLPLPPSWIVACNGHRSNPWFLDGLRSLLELADGLASNAFGTHLGYGAALGKRLHWLSGTVEQDLSRLSPQKARLEALEWQERQRLSRELAELLERTAGETMDQPELLALLEPFWGLRATRSPEALRSLLGR